MLFLKVFSFVPGAHVSKLVLNRDAFRVPTGSSGSFLGKVYKAKKESWKVTFCVDRTPYIEVRDRLGWRCIYGFSTPCFRETLRREESHTEQLFPGFRAHGATCVEMFLINILQPERQDPQAGRKGSTSREIAKPFSNFYL